MAASPTSTPFGRYQLLRKLAAGGMAEVYLAELATSAGVSKQLVIKKILKSFADDLDFREMFIGEARIAVRLSHGNIAQVFDFGEVNGEYFLALEYVYGRSLADLFKRANELQLSLPVEFSAFIALQMCQGLNYAHTRLDAQQRPLHLVHRDISPQNVLISYEGQVKIVDFGIAKAYGPEGAEVPERSIGEPGTQGSNHTATGVVKGKYLYFSPEQASAQRLDGLTDVYATGVVLYEMACGRRPFDGQMYAVLAKLLAAEFEPPRHVRPEIPEELEAVILRAMAYRKEDRFPSALAMQEALAGFLAAYAPRMTEASLTNLMRYLFRSELESAGVDAQVPEAFASQVRAWAQTDRGPGRAGATRREAPPTVPQRGLTGGLADTFVRTSPRRTGLIAAGVGALILGAAGALYLATRPSEPLLLETVHVGNATPAAPTAPPAAAPPPAPAPTPAPPPPNLLAALPRLSTAQRDGRRVDGLRCTGAATTPAAQAIAAQATAAAGDSRFNEAMGLLDQAIAAEPTAGSLYLALADDATGALSPTHVEVVLRDLETFRAACPPAQRAPTDSAWDRLGELLPLPDTGLDPASKRELVKYRNEAADLIRRGYYTDAMLSVQAGLALSPQDPALKRMAQQCENPPRQPGLPSIRKGR